MAAGLDHSSAEKRWTLTLHLRTVFHDKLEHWNKKAAEGKTERCTTDRKNTLMVMMLINPQCVLSFI